jgi:hypothetical protein
MKILFDSEDLHMLILVDCASCIRKDREEVIMVLCNTRFLIFFCCVTDDALST